MGAMKKYELYCYNYFIAISLALWNFFFILLVWWVPDLNRSLLFYIHRSRIWIFRTIVEKLYFGIENLFQKNTCINQCSGSEINNFGSGSSNWKSRISDPDPRSGSFCELVMVKKSFQFWVITRHKWVEIFNFLNFSRTVYEILMNFFTF